MDKAQAINAFWNSFGLPAYDERTLPDSVKMPYITYEVGTASLDEPIILSANLWYTGNSWQAISQKATEIEEYITTMTPIKIDTGRVFITKGTPFSSRYDEPEDRLVRRILINIGVEYLTN